MGRMYPAGKGVHAFSDTLGRRVKVCNSDAFSTHAENCAVLHAHKSGTTFYFRTNMSMYLLYSNRRGINTALLYATRGWQSHHFLVVDIYIVNYRTLARVFGVRTRHRLRIRALLLGGGLWPSPRRRCCGRCCGRWHTRKRGMQCTMRAEHVVEHVVVAPLSHSAADSEAHRHACAVCQ